MGGCRCSYRTCRSATKLSSDLHFFHYPVKHRERCEVWIRNAQRTEFLMMPDDQLRNKVVCDLHFEPRYFTNVQRRRLVHDAIPTLNGGCEAERSNENSNEYKDVQILPTNEDGTMFTVDTDSMQQRQHITQPVVTYTLRDGTLVPIYTDDFDSGDQFVYTIHEDDFKQLAQTRNKSESYLYSDPNNQDEDSNDVEIIYNGNSAHVQLKRKIPVEPTVDNIETKQLVALPAKTPTSGTPSSSLLLPCVTDHPKEEMEVDYIEEHVEGNSVPDPKIVKDEPGMIETKATSKLADVKVKAVYKNTSPQQVRKKFLRQIKLHSREIASIKRTLNFGFKRIPRRGIVNALRGRISPTLLGALTLNLDKKVANFTNEELMFISTLYKTSPEMYNTFIEKLQWALPQPSIVEELLKNTSSD